VDDSIGWIKFSSRSPEKCDAAALQGGQHTLIPNLTELPIDDSAIGWVWQNQQPTLAHYGAGR
jgi:hypothetical protein